MIETHRIKNVVIFIQTNLSCYVLSPNICAPKKVKSIYVKVLNMITNTNEAKATAEHISCACKWKFNSTTCNSNQKWNNKTCQYGCKSYRKWKNHYENSKYSKSTAHTSVTEYDEIIIVMDIASTKKTNTIVTKITGTASINGQIKKVRACYVLLTFLLAILLLLILIIICYYYANKKVQNKVKNNRFIKVSIKICTCLDSIK